jgi:hypothetical protein
MEQYHAEEDRNRRLNGTICMYDGNPVYIRCSDPHGRITLKADEVFITEPTNVFDYSGYRVVKYTDDKFCAKAFPLGYANHREGICYVTRKPHQQQRAGIHEGVIDVKGDSSTHHFIYSQAMVDCIKGNYPTFEEARKTVSQGKPVAFTRFLAFRPLYKNIYTLEYRGRPAGIVKKDDVLELFEGKESRIIKALASEYIKEVQNV